MALTELADKLGTIAPLDRVAGPVVGAVKSAIGPGVLKDVLSGTPLGHPLHPMLTDVPIGSFTSAAVLDLLGGRRARGAADLLVAVGLVSALPTAAAGVADWSDTYGAEQRIGTVHALANLAGLGLYAMSLRARLQHRRGAGKVLGLAGMATMTAGGYLGGHLSYARGVGVNNTFHEHRPGDWTPVLDGEDLAEGELTEVEVGDAAAVVYRRGDEVHAIAARCSHAGGPLQEGTVDPEALTVTCPWHQSVFCLRDGRALHGPASAPQPAYDVRRSGGRIEVRART